MLPVAWQCFSPACGGERNNYPRRPTKKNEASWVFVDSLYAGLALISSRRQAFVFQGLEPAI